MKDDTIPSDVLADAQTVADCISEGKPVPDDVAQRVHQRAATIRQRVLDQYGIVDVGVSAIRELRGELPE